MFDKIKSEMNRIESEYQSGSLNTIDVIQEITGLSNKLEDVAVGLADIASVSFSVGEYGSGRTYYPYGHEYWDESEAEDYGVGDHGGYWLSSSAMC